MSTWKRGTVAMVTYEGRTRIGLHGDQGWSFGDLHSWLGDAFPADVRPLVVIDPEDAEDVERLVTLYCNQFPIARGPEDDEAMADALREFANPKPPKPDEPTGLGAVVRDESGVEYIHLGAGQWAYATTDGPSNPSDWAHVHAVEVLSEGVIA